MTIWAWLIVGLSGGLFLSLAATLGVAAILGSISDDITSLLEAEPYTLAPTHRARARSATL